MPVPERTARWATSAIHVPGVIHVQGLVYVLFVTLQWAGATVALGGSLPRQTRVILQGDMGYGVKATVPTESHILR